MAEVELWQLAALQDEELVLELELALSERAEVMCRWMTAASGSTAPSVRRNRTTAQEAPPFQVFRQRYHQFVLA